MDRQPEIFGVDRQTTGFGEPTASFSPALVAFLEVYSGEKRALLRKLLLGKNVSILQRSFVYSLEKVGISQDQVVDDLRNYGFTPDSPITEFARSLRGDVFQKLAQIFFRDLLHQRGEDVTLGTQTARTFKSFREDLNLDKSRFGVIPDGIVVKKRRKQIVIVGFSEYALSAHNSAGKDRQLANLLNVVDLVFEEPGKRFIESFRKNVPDSWSTNIQFGRRKDFRIYYVIPSDQYLPYTLKHKDVEQINMPLAASDVVELTKVLAGDFFRVSIA